MGFIGVVVDQRNTGFLIVSSLDAVVEPVLAGVESTVVTQVVGDTVADDRTAVVVAGWAFPQSQEDRHRRRCRDRVRGVHMLS